MAIGPKLDPKKWYYSIEIYIPISIYFSIVFELLPRGNSNVNFRNFFQKSTFETSRFILGRDI